MIIGIIINGISTDTSIYIKVLAFKNSYLELKATELIGVMTKE